MAGIGHNQGPTMEPGAAWRRHSWGKARAALLPVLPIEVLRHRVRRAREIGLDYSTYASIRAASGHDVIAFLFSTNALRLLGSPATLSARHHADLCAITGANRAALVRPPLQPAQVLALAQGALDDAHPAPRPFATWAEARATLRGALAGRKLPADGVVLVGDTSEERAWGEAAQLAAYLPADRYFLRRA